MQLVPAIAGVAAHVTVFQRSPQWAVPNAELDRAVSAETQWLLAQLPFYSGWYRYREFWQWNDHIHPTLQIDPDWPHQDRSINALNESHRVFLTEHITRTLEGRPDLIAKCLPTYPPYGKRGLMDAGWFATMRRDDVSLVTEPVTAIRPGGLVTADGAEHAADVIAYATGFHAQKMLWPMDVHGRDGTIREAWGDDDPRAYLGIAIPGFPNFFTLYGPNTNLGHGGSVVFHTELQVRYTMGLICAMVEGGISAAEVRAEVCAEYNDRLDEAHSRMIWSHRGMDTWYRNAKGRIVTNSPWRLADYWRMTREPDLSEYHLEHVSD
jgi:4-hydroxyacetophenone monooxygenase